MTECFISQCKRDHIKAGRAIHLLLLSCHCYSFTITDNPSSKQATLKLACIGVEKITKKNLKDSKRRNVKYVELVKLSIWPI